jgi:uncharacterized protein (TIGR04255 family)
VEIKINQVFEHLPHAPIVEAVIDIRARTTQKLEESSLISNLEVTSTGYGFLDSQRQFQFQVGGGQPTSQTVQDLGWKGVRFRSSDGKHIAQFNRDGFVFSRLEPYTDWEQLSSEGLRLWNVFRELAQPALIRRIGVRFINRIQLPATELHFEDYITSSPLPPAGLELPFHGFMHHDTLAVPGHPYSINIIRTIQPSAGNGGAGIGVILDIDVFTGQEFEPDEAKLLHRLSEMRWLKNKAFFGSVTDKALERFR